MFFHKMREQMKVVIIVVVAAMVGGMLWAGGSALFGRKNAQTTQAAAVAATVNGQAISLYDLHQTFISRLQQLEQEKGIIPGRSYEAVRFQALDSLVGSLVISQEIANRNLSASKADIDQELQSIIDQFPSVDDYKMQLQLVGLTEEALKSRIAEEVKFNKLKAEIIGDLPVSEEEVKEAYEQVRASHILIKPEGQTEEAWAEAESKALEVHAEVNADNFAEMAKEYSADTSGPQGGDIGFVARGITVQEFEDAVFTLEIGAISEPVRSTYGYHIITVTERKEAVGEEFEEVRSLIEDMIRSEKGQEDLIAWFEEVREAANIVYTDYQMNAFAQMQAEKFEDAVHYYKLAIEQQPNDGYLYASLGDAYAELENMDEAIGQYQLAVEKFTTDHNLFIGLGDLYSQAERIDEAVEAYLKASELAPNDVWTQLTLYSHLNRFERYEEAKAIEDRIAAIQEMQNEWLKQQEATNEAADVEAEEQPVEAPVDEPIEQPAEAPVDEPVDEESAPEN